MTVKRWQTFLEIDISYCSLTFGVSPCTAAIGGTVTQKCFNTVGSCVDRENYDETFVTLRFTKDSGYQAESGIEAIPSLIDVELTPGRISLGEDLGQRPSASCVLREHPHSDAGLGFDKYLSSRSYDPYKQGHFWAKFAARHPNLRGKKLRVIQGYVGQTLAQMETHHYIIDSIDGPTSEGTFKIIAKDPLKSLDGERAQAPAVSQGYLNASIDASTTAASLAPVDIGDAEYPSSGFATIGGKEIVAFTRVGNALTLTRAQKGTTASAHDAGDRVQLCLNLQAVSPADIIHQLETEFGAVDPSYIPLSDWQDEVSTWNGQVYTRFIPEPQPVKKLTAEIVEQAGLATWWDEIEQKQRLQVLRQIATDAHVYDETVIREGTLRISAQPNKRHSQIWTYFAPRNPLEGDDVTNFQGVAVLIDTDAEKDYGSPSVKEIVSHWIPAGGRLIAERLNEIQLGRYLVPPRLVEFHLIESEGTVSPQLGGGYRLSVPSLQNADGSRFEMPFQVVRIKKKDGVIQVTGEEVSWVQKQASDPLNRFVTIDYNAYDLNFRSLHDDLYGEPTLGGTVTLIVASNAVVGSTSVLTPSLQTGTWPSQAFTATRANGNPTLTGIADTSDFVEGQAVTGTGIPDDSRVVSKTVDSVTLDKNATSSGTSSLTLWTTILKVQMDGQIIGHGGKGGIGRGGDGNTGGTGEAGGTGLKVTAPIEILGAGKIDGGGGGGGGGGGDYAGWFGPQINGGGGGGGAGAVPGAGGTAAGRPGNPGTLTDGGAGGNSTGDSSHRGGDGGDPGANGNAASGLYKGSGGAGGKSVDGNSLVKDTAFTGAYRGSKIN